MDKATLLHFRDSVAAGGYIGGADNAAIAAFGEHAMLAQNATLGREGVDAAVAFKEALLPGWYWRCGRTTLFDGWAFINRLDPNHCDRLDEASGQAPTPGKALVVAVLNALIALAEGRLTAQPTSFAMPAQALNLHDCHAQEKAAASRATEGRTDG
ncbi:hypothetical protein [Ancylobacter sp. SL191]|uniref:hypothetical protein n=1 Tax=Ancylobacter sp. SL191 TaxID=2995166 RepID=UPI002271DEC8|nr:hypothetical protein [Ancylobacter sp. SL191]WAC26382.1 hypothetical protein OU996_15355 [Ancylobacter sp. SL191]